MIRYYFRSNSYLVGFKNLLKSIECQNIATSFGIRYYGRGSLTAENFVSYVRYEFMAREMINSTLNYAPMLKEMYTNITCTKKFHRAKQMWVFRVNFYRYPIRS